MEYNTTDRGILLTENITMDDLKNITPRFHPDYIKFVVNVETNKVCVGMFNHADACVILGDQDDLYGGNIFFNDGNIIYTSTLNIKKNIKLKEFKRKLGLDYKHIDDNKHNPRIIEDKELISMINSILFSWIEI